MMHRRLLLVASPLLLMPRAWAQPLPPPGGSGGAGGGYTATTAGAVNLTGTTSETNMAALRIPANSMGANGVAELYVLWTYTNNANTKTMTTRFTPVSGSIVGGATGSPLTATTTTSAQSLFILRNNNATNAQTFWPPSPGTPFGTAAPTIGALTVDTTQDSYINLNGTLAVGTDTLTLQHALLVVYPHG